MKSIFKFIFLSLLIAICSCNSTSKLSNNDISPTYRPERQLLHPQYTVHHLSYDSSVVYIKIPVKEIGFKKESDNYYSSQLLLKFSSYASLEKSSILDTAEFNFSTQYITDTNAFIIKQFVIKLPLLQQAELKAELRDINRNALATSIIHIDKSKQSSQQFLVTDASNGLPYFKNYFTGNTKVSITCSDNTRPLYVRIFWKKYPLALPPFAMDGINQFSYYADTGYVLEPSLQHEISLPEEAVYHLQFDTLEKNGLTLFRFDDDFPSLTKQDQLLETLRYITSNSEYNEMLSMPDKTAAIDNFWLQTSGSRERGRMLIKKYYQRVENANRFFTSYLEGWKTDRGMIYIVFGAPDAVFRSNDGEYWRYNTKHPLPGINFLFKKLNNPFTGNDYVLQRQPSYEPEWFMMVDNWRQGRLVE